MVLLHLIVDLYNFAGVRRIGKKQIRLKNKQYGQRKIDKYERRHQTERIIDHGEENSEDEFKLSNEGYKHIIRRDLSLSVNKGLELPSKRPEYDTKDLKKEFHISDIMYFAKGELKTWNFLTRTRSQGYQFISLRVTIIWVLGCCLRYLVLLPFRVLLLTSGLLWLIASTAIIGYLPNSGFKKKLNEYVSLMSHRILARACSGVMRFHNRENRAQNGICVANHTSPIDVILLSCDNCYAMGGLIGIIQRAMSRATAHIWFERSEAKDRELVLKRLQEHVADKDKLPILIFPEGTCINNTSVMMFKKGSFEVCPTIYPVAIKYDPRFGDAFWNSSKMGMVSHVFEILTSWALVVDRLIKERLCNWPVAIILLL
ncbi:hypothetical protein KUTeg_005106 [Tegillarca granosa]|uniref:Phospholipid/glycerol acyltransferase domain-containing protein n=1 Tax=Tegillarca granosa TaxID=220873 RepID=A0ABQ9FMN8_TEGGR|nr:hypothetical protein KUTeg_005106 [Tegillarca granosa]